MNVQSKETPAGVEESAETSLASALSHSVTFGSDPCEEDDHSLAEARLAAFGLAVINEDV